MGLRTVDAAVFTPNEYDWGQASDTTMVGEQYRFTPQSCQAWRRRDQRFSTVMWRAIDEEVSIVLLNRGDGEKQ